MSKRVFILFLLLFTFFISPNLFAQNLGEQQLAVVDEALIDEADLLMQEIIASKRSLEAEEEHMNIGNQKDESFDDLENNAAFDDGESSFKGLEFLGGDGQVIDSAALDEQECLTCDLNTKEKPRTSDAKNSKADVTVKEERITLDFKESNLEEVFRLLSEIEDINILVDPLVKDLEVDLHLKEVTFDEALNLISNAYDLRTSKVGQSLFVSSYEKINSMNSVTKIIKLKNINAENAENLIRNVVESVVSDKEINALVMSGSPLQIEEAASIVKKVDVPQRQVLLATQVLEVNRDSLRETGIDWNDSSTINFQEIKRPAAADGSSVINGADSAFHIFRMAREPLKLQMVIKFLIENNKARILTNPKMTTVNGKEASLFIGDRIPYEITKVSGGTATTEVQFTEAGIKLTLTPSIIEDDYVVVTVAPEISFIYAWAGENEQYPWVRTREAKASVRVRQNETFILGGLISEEDKESIDKVPFLGDLPFIGKLFQFHQKTKDNKEIIITVTPHILD